MKADFGLLDQALQDRFNVLIPDAILTAEDTLHGGPIFSFDGIEVRLANFVSSNC